MLYYNRRYWQDTSKYVSLDFELLLLGYVNCRIQTALRDT